MVILILILILKMFSAVFRWTVASHGDCPTVSSAPPKAPENRSNNPSNARMRMRMTMRRINRFPTILTGAHSGMK